MACTCGNPRCGYIRVCDWVKKNPGTHEYCCEFCGIYDASKPRCNCCKESDESKRKHEVVVANA